LRKERKDGTCIFFLVTSLTIYIEFRSGYTSIRLFYRRRRESKKMIELPSVS